MKGDSSFCVRRRPVPTTRAHARARTQSKEPTGPMLHAVRNTLFFVIIPKVFVQLMSIISGQYSLVVMFAVCVVGFAVICHLVHSDRIALHSVSIMHVLHTRCFLNVRTALMTRCGFLRHMFRCRAVFAALCDHWHQHRHRFSVTRRLHSHLCSFVDAVYCRCCSRVIMTEARVSRCQMWTRWHMVLVAMTIDDDDDDEDDNG